MAATGLKTASLRKMKECPVCGKWQWVDEDHIHEYPDTYSYWVPTRN